MGRIGFAEIAIIVVVVILLFGVKRLPELARSVGEAVKEFRTSLKAGTSEKQESDDSPS